MLRVILFIFSGFITFLSVAQHTQDDIHFHDCDLHSCASLKTENFRSGTYDQNPLLWDYDVSYYGLDVTVDPQVSAISGSVRVVASVVVTQMQTFVLELLSNMNVDSVIMQEQIIDFDHLGDELHIKFPIAALQGDLLDIVVYYHGQPQGDGFFSGFRTGVTPYGKPILWTLSEPLNARQWWPVKQVLEDKADSVSIIINTPMPNVGASNGLLLSTQALDNDMVRYHWASNYPIAYYLISLAVSEYDQYNFFAPLSEPENQVFVQNFIYDNPEYILQQVSNIERTIGFMQIFSELFGDYPFASEKYGHATAPLGGGMEHQTLSTMAGFPMDLVSHELVHQWFGNSVTCATWSDIWINEGFASYGEYLGREFLINVATANEWMTLAHNSVLSQPGGSVYVPPLETTEVWRIFNSRLSYKKGAAILHILRNEINNDPLFFEILQTFLQQFKDSVASGDDFKLVVEELTGASWQFFFDQWYYGEGHPVFKITWWQEENQVFIRSLQTGSTQNPAFFLTSLDFVLYAGGQQLPVRFFQQYPEQVFSFPVDENADSLFFDPENWLLKQAAVSRMDAAPGFDISIAPNPFTDKFTILSPYFSGDQTYRVFDMMGKEIISGVITGTETQVALPLTARGILLLEVSNKASGPWITKIMRVP